jgi:hypothetical protein
MADEGTATAPTGQAAAPADNAATATAPEGGQGQPQATDQTTTPSGTGAASGEDTFFDPRDLDPALQPAYKNMQKAFSKKMEAIAQHRQKIEAYDQFSKDPLGTIQTIASRLGYRLTRAEAAEVAQQAADPQTKSWEPQTWDEVMAKAEERAEQRIMGKLSPIFEELQTVKKSSMEKLLDESAPDWREHEEEMIAILREHPTLAKDPVKLYRMALPPEILESRATQAALKKLQAKADSSKVGGTSTTKQQSPAVPDKPLSFNEAVEFAKRQLAEKGLRGPR